MTQKIEIPVEAKLNAQQAEAAAQKLERALANLGRRKVDPVSNEAVKKLEALYATYLKLDRETARRQKDMGGGGSLGDMDLDRMYLGGRQRNSKRRQMRNFFGQHGFGDLWHDDPRAAPQPNAGGGGRKGGGGWGGVAGGMAQAGLRAAGPVGGAAASALGTGMSAGAGAGLMGLIGGLGALGVSKLVGMVTDNIGKAEDNNVAYDRLKRTLGDVNVSFNALKSSVMTTGDGLKVSYGEMAQLTSSYAKAGNLSGSDYKAMSEELGLGVGLSKAYGLDHGVGVGALGQMRGVGAIGSTQETRAMALLIGETIAKSNSFAKADEVMEAIAGFATAQTRQSLAVANTASFAGMFSAMVGSGIPGMDPAGAGNILNRMNSSLSAGGAKGEASQFFTAMVGNRMGLDPLQTQILREGGMFASKNDSFGEGSVYARYMGKAGPSGGQDFLSATRNLIEEKYAGDSDEQKMLRANAFSGHTGLNMRQSMAMLSLSANQMGGLQKYAGDMSTLSASGINNMALSLYGSDEQRAGVRSSLLGRADLSAKDRKDLEATTVGSEAEKEVLAKLSAQYEQERTTGKDIADSKVLLDNIKTSLADKLVPAMQNVRDAMLYMAGGKDGMTLDSMRQKLVENQAKEERDKAEKEIEAKRGQLVKDTALGRISGAEFKTQNAELDAQSAAATRTYEQATKQGGVFRGSGASGSWGDDAPPRGQAGGTASGSPTGPSGGADEPSGPAGMSVTSEGTTRTITREDGSVETRQGGTRSWRNHNPGNIEYGKFAKSQGAIGTDGRFAVFPNKETGDKARIALLRGKSYAHLSVSDAIKKYAPAFENDTGAYINAVTKGAGLKGDEKMGALSDEQMQLVADAMRKHEGWKVGKTSVKGGKTTKVPDAKSNQAAGNTTANKYSFSAEPVDVRVLDSSGRPIAPAQQLNFQVKPPAASFADRWDASSGGATGGW